MFRVKVVGTYIARSGVMEKEKVKKSYEIEGNIPTTYAALSTVKNKLLGPSLSKKYPDYITFLTYHITEITPLDEKSRLKMAAQEVSFMDRKSLLTFVRDNGLKVKHEYYPNLFRLREAVQFAKDDPDGYVKNFKIKEADLKLDLDMAACNPGLFQDDSAGVEGIIASNIPGSAVRLPGPIQELDPSKPFIKNKASSPSALAKKTDDRLKGFVDEEIKDGNMGPMDNMEAPLDVGDL